MNDKTFKAGIMLGILGGIIAGFMLSIAMYPFVILALMDKL